MILIASPQSDLALQWRDALVSNYKIYDVVVQERRSLELCLKKVTFDALIIDMALFEDNSINEISALKELQPDINIIVMTNSPDEREEISAVLFGAKAYCSTQINIELLPKVLKTVLANELWVDRKFVTRLLKELEGITKIKHAEATKLDKGIERMTPRECEIAKLVATGASNRRIADLLNISERTVKAHLGVIFKKIGLNDRLQLALYMNRHQQISAIWHGTRQETQLKPSSSNRKY